MSLSITLIDSKTGTYIRDITASEDTLEVKLSLNNLAISKIDIPSEVFEDVPLNDYDYLYIYYGRALKFYIARVNHIQEASERVTIEFILDSQMYQRQEYLPSNSNTLSDYTVDNYEQWAIVLQGTHIVLANDNTLYSDQIVRQVMRKTSQYVEYDIDNKIVYLKTNDDAPYKLRLDDLRLEHSSTKIELADDSLNEVLLIDKTDHEQSESWFLNSDGTGVTQIRPTGVKFVNDVVFVEPTQQSDPAIAYEILIKDKYNNSIEFVLDYNDGHDFILFDRLLSHKMELIIPKMTRLTNGRLTNDDQVVESIVSEITFKNGRLWVKCGLTQSKLTTILASDN